MIKADHFILHARDCDASARFLAEVLGLQYGGLNSRGLAELPINADFKLLYEKRESISEMHAAFLVDEETVRTTRAALERLGAKFGSHPRETENMSDDHFYGGKGFYFRDINGHLLEIMTKNHPD